jgi:hypothetical protein
MALFCGCLRRFAGVIRASCRSTRNLEYLAIPQAWFSTRDAKPIRDLMRDLERVNRGEPLIEDRGGLKIEERTVFLIQIETYV